MSISYPSREKSLSAAHWRSSFSLLRLLRLPFHNVHLLPSLPAINRCPGINGFRTTGRSGVFLYDQRILVLTLLYTSA